MFQRLLIANRGEIACRVMRTAERMGIDTVAVYSEADTDALHVALADEAVPIGPAPARESYLNAAAILAAAQASGAGALHPGYGFLAENADFAEACGAAGLIFVGPPPAAIRAMGAKDQAKARMAAAGVPILPGYHGKGQSPKRLAEGAADIGFPVLIKPAAGGGGKGMRLVEAVGAFPEALDGARREAAAAFGDDRVIIEKFLDRPRHIEVQIFADSHGNAVHLFERDCSTQRRHQKVIEEAPAPGLDAARRAEMGAAAVRAGQAIGDGGAGTIEFLYDGKLFYFMEMNTRLQVEHPVTEMITGLDLVEWQLRVAAGEALPAGQDAIEMRGHALEARLYAEDPARDFLPAAGRLHRLRFPQDGRHLRIDSGVREGDRIPLDYDPMIAKLVVWDRDRPAVLKRLSRALEDTQVVGVANNLSFLATIAADSDFVAGGVDTQFIARHAERLLHPAEPAGDEILALACLAELLRRGHQAAAQARRSSDWHSPWHLTTGWRLNMETQSLLRFEDGGQEVTVVVVYRRDGYLLWLPGGPVSATGELDDQGALSAELDGRPVTAAAVHWNGTLTILSGGRAHSLRLHDPLAGAARETAGGGRLTAPMPGRVVQVRVRTGDQVARGAALLVLEAMKMEHTIVAPIDGAVAAVHYGEGDLVEEGVDLIDIAPDEPRD
jgi:3-methylcrotonyl-CoA carboxylase alpha subunit